SASSLKRPQRDWSDGIGLFLRQEPQAYSKKSSQGLTVLSIASRSKDLGRVAFFSLVVCAAATPIITTRTIKYLPITKSLQAVPRMYAGEKRQVKQATAGKSPVSLLWAHGRGSSIIFGCGN